MTINSTSLLQALLLYGAVVFAIAAYTWGPRGRRSR
jgi:hypothetical protein